MPSETEIRPFRVDMPDEAIADLRQRIAATRWPSRELVADRSQGVQLATIQELAVYWTTEYDWRAFKAALNALPQFTTEIDGEDVHFIHVRSLHQDALPPVITHGSPGSIIELLGVIGQPSSSLTRDSVVDNIALYWLTATGASAAGRTGRTPKPPPRRPGSPVRRSSSRSASARSPARSSGPRAAGSRSPSPTSPTSTRPTRAATSPPGKSPSCSRPRSGRRSSRCANHSRHPGSDGDDLVHDQADLGYDAKTLARHLSAHLAGGAGTGTAFWLLARIL